MSLLVMRPAFNSAENLESLFHKMVEICPEAIFSTVSASNRSFVAPTPDVSEAPITDFRRTTIKPAESTLCRTRDEGSRTEKAYNRDDLLEPR